MEIKTSRMPSRSLPRVLIRHTDSDLVEGTSTTSFITPQRGGLVIYNPSSSSTSSLDPPFHTFSRQLKLLLGLPLLSPSATTSQSRSQQIESLIAVRLAESLKDTTSTLTNLIQTITEADGQQASNISVGLNVQSRVEKALDLLDSVRSFPFPPSTCFLPASKY
jgi:phosphatidylinositol glycan class S